jgi:hypothetical protein
MHLRSVERHRQHPIGARCHEEVGDETSADRDPWRVLLVAAHVGVVRDGGRDARRRGSTRGVEHQQELHQVLVDGRYERLDDEDVALAAIRVELYLEAVVAKAA